MLKVMQIGYGYWGANVARKLIASTMFSFCYLADADADRRKEAEKKLPVQVKIIEDYKKYLDTDIDAVVICTQTKYSFDIAMNAMAHGKHVFTEKPIAINVDKTKQLIAKAKETNLTLHCDHLMVYNPVIQYIKRMIDSGEIGDIMYIDIARMNLGPIRKDINAMLDLAVHDIALIDYLLGKLVPDQLSAYGTKFFGAQETLTYLTMKCDSVLININSSWISPIKVRRITVAGTQKMLIFDDLKTDNKLSIYNRGIEVVQGREYGEYEYKTRTGDIFTPYIEMSDSLQNSLEHFAKCVLEQKESLSGPEQSLRVMKVLEHAQKLLHGA